MGAGDVHEHVAERFFHALGMAVAVAAHVGRATSLGEWLRDDVDQFFLGRARKIRRRDD